MTSADDLTAGRDRAEELLRRLADDEGSADALLAELTEVRELAFVGAGLTAIARSEGRLLPPAMRAQAATRQVHLGTLRDRSRTDPAGLRAWLRGAAEEVRLLRRLRVATEHVAGSAGSPSA